MVRRLCLLIFTFLFNADSTGITEYRASADRLIGLAMRDDGGINRLRYLCNDIGNRQVGSASLERAIAWSAEEMKLAGLSNVRTIAVQAPRWIRGRESARIVAPYDKPLSILGLGGSAGTPKAGITAEVVSVSTFAELEKLGRAVVAGKIVLFDAPYAGYDETVAYRTEGASRAGRFGAVAALVRSITPDTSRDPHTGALTYLAGDPKIPAAAVSVEDAEWLHNLTRSGKRVRAHLELEAHFGRDAASADVMGELVGREKPDEVVAIGGHIDSWDVGQGANDDGSGVMAALEAVALMKRLGLQPRRTIRVVFWTDEELGGNGAKAYRKWIGDTVGKHVAAIEMDGGAEHPVGFEFDAKTFTKDFRARVAAISQLLKPIGADRLISGSSEADVEPLMNAGVPVLGLRTAMTHYFEYHHSRADTFDKIVPEDFRRCVAAFAVMSYVLADWN